MSIVYVGSDYHLGHSNIADFGQRPIKDSIDNYTFIGDNWAAKKRDSIYLLGDIVFEENALEFLQGLPGRKILIPGNHDWQYFKPSLHDLAKTFDEIRGTTSYKGAWLSHFPIHYSEKYRKVMNVHGHIHDENTNTEVRDNPFYVNVNIDYMYPKHGKIMVNWQDLKTMVSEEKY